MAREQELGEDRVWFICDGNFAAARLSAEQRAGVAAPDYQAKLEFGCEQKQLLEQPQDVAPDATSWAHAGFVTFDVTSING
jgi:hypothetical protein